MEKDEKIEKDEEMEKDDIPAKQAELEVKTQREVENSAPLQEKNRENDEQDQAEASTDASMRKLLKAFHEDMREEMHIMRVEVQQEMMLFREVLLISSLR